ncbi:MAG: helix-turn-helix domain-containing protein [Acidimicrobiales bacterium]
MDLAQRLADRRHGAGLTQQALADRVGIHVSNIRRYEAGTSQPTLDVLRNLALALNCSADSLLFDDADRGPDEDLRLQFEAASAQLDEEGKQLVRALIEGVLLRHEARRWANAG